MTLTDSLNATIAANQPTPDELVAEIDEAENAVEKSGMGASERQATLDKLRGQRTTPQQAMELAEAFPPKSSKPVKRKRFGGFDSVRGLFGEQRNLIISRGIRCFFAVRGEQALSVRAGE